ncbi:MAG TPA: hypothetical protein VFQ61_06450 [Polyangiaceae bacterium]|nr:hypothetical protein [Polyangiaceae bacterium]
MSAKEKSLAPPAAAAAPDAPKPAKAKRSKGGKSSAVTASERAQQRITELLAAVQARAEQIMQAQRQKPDRWQHFASLAELEDRLRRVLD